jgi:hypothetical protein
MLAGARMDAVRKTPFYAKYVAGSPQPWLDKFVEETGLDPRKDLSELLIASNGKDAVVIARGKFNESDLSAKVEKEGAQRIPYKGHTLIGNEHGALLFMNSTTAVAGRPAQLRSIVDQFGRSTGIPAPLRTKVDFLPANSQLWAVALGGFQKLPVPKTGNLSNLGRMLAMLESATVAADLRSGINITAQGRCPTEKDATTLESALRGLIGLARLSTPDNRPDLLRFYDAIQVNREQNSVRLNADIPLDLFDKLLKSLGEKNFG